MPADLIEEVPALDDIEAELARRLFSNFVTYTFPSYFWNWHHDRLCEALQGFADGKIRRLLVMMPPRHGKSELVSRRLPGYLLGRFPDSHVIACSYGADLASRMNRDVQRIIDTPSYAKVFPGTRLNLPNSRIAKDGQALRNSDIFEIVNRQGSYRSAGVGGGITGMGCHFGIIDDPIKNREEANSQVYREKVWEWYTTTFYTRLEENAGVLVTATRWHDDDLIGRLLKASASGDEFADDWTVLEFPAIKDGEGRTPDARPDGAPLWSVKYDIRALSGIKATLGSYAFTALYQQRPTPSGGGLIKRDWFKFYREAPAEFDRVVQSWDMAFKDLVTSDYVVGQVWGVIGARKYLLDQVRGQWSFPVTVQAFRALSAKWPQAYGKLVEDKANGTAVIATLRDEIEGIIAVEPEGGKEARAAACSPTIEAGNVYLPESAPWVGDFLVECELFPNGANDDQVDGMTQALIRFRSAQHEILGSKVETDEERKQREAQEEKDARERAAQEVQDAIRTQGAYWPNG